MYKNVMKKLKFNMKDVRVFDSFAGVGALLQSLKELGVPTKLIGISEVDVDCIIDYAGIHIDNFKDMNFEYPSEDIMKKYLMDRNIGYDFKKNKSTIPRLRKDKLKLCYKASILTNNLGDISKLNYDEIEDFDLFNLSFCCQDISGAGKQKGLKNADGTPTRSGLVKYGIEVIKHKRPKYIMIENVKGLIQKNFIDDFYDIVNEIEGMGYTCYYPTKEDKKGNKNPICLNAKNYGIPQNRERIFIICVRKDVDNGTFKFWEGKDFGIRLKDILEDKVDEKYYLSEEVQKRFKLNGNEDLEHNELNVVGSSAPDFRTIGQRDMTYGINGIMSTLTATDYKQPKQIIDNKLNQIGEIDLQGYNDFSKRVYDVEGVGRTLMSSGGNLNDKAGQYLIDYRIRRLTPLECWRLMGFRDEHIQKAIELGTSDSQLYKQAGNSIVVNCLYYIFKELFKEYIEE